MLENTLKSLQSKRACVVACAFAFVAATGPGLAVAGVGDLKLIARAPGMDPFRAFAMTCKEFAPVGDNGGSVNEKAVIARISGGSLMVAAAVDSLKPDAETFDVVRLDFSGKGRFGGAPAFPLKKISAAARPGSGASAFVFGPTAAQVLHGGGRIPVFVEGVCFIEDERVKSLQISIGAVAEGACGFGDKVYGVRVIDADGKLGANNAPSAEEMEQPVWSPPGAPVLNPDAVDIVEIDTKNETFQRGDLQAVVGRVAYVQGQWWRVSVSDDGAKISAEKISSQTGTVVVGHDNWAATLIGAEHVLSVRGGRKPVPVPVDSYVIRRYRQFALCSGSPRAAVLTVEAVPDSDMKGLAFRADPGKAVPLKIGSPVNLKIKADTAGGGYAFGFAMVDVSGMKASVSLPGQPAPPAVKVVDSEDQQVHSGSMEYG